MMLRLHRVAWLLLPLLVGACGASQSEPTTSEEPALPAGAEHAETEAPSPSTKAPKQADADGDAESDDEASHEAKLAEAERRREQGAPKEREVIYRVTPEGLVVDVDGVRFKPKAEPTKKPNGGYGIKITVEAESTDDDTHVLLSPEHGPLSFAVTIFDKNGSEHARYGDQRSGDEQQFIMPGGPLTLMREWPSGSVKGPLWWGQRVRLEAGLWGLGRADEKSRPMQKFFVVEMVGGAKAQAVLTPPGLQ